MITAGVQQALQTLEVSGAPASALPDTAVPGEEFRQAFTAKVGGNLSPDGSDVPPTAKRTRAGVSQSERTTGQTSAARVLSFEQAQTAAQSLKALTLAAEEAAREKSNSTAVSSSKSTAAAGSALAAESTAVNLEGTTDAPPQATSVPALANAEAGRQGVLAKDPSVAASASRISAVADLATGSLPVTFAPKADGSRQEVENAGARDRKHEVASSTPEAGTLQAPSSTHGLIALAAAEAGPLLSSTVITSSTSVSDGRWSAEASVALSVSVAAPFASAEGTLSAVGAENAGDNKVNRGDAASLAVASLKGLAGATLGDQAIADASGGRSTSSSVAIAKSASAGTENLGRSSAQPGVNGRSSEGVSERIGVSPVVPNAGLSSGLSNIRKVAAFSSTLESTLASTLASRSALTGGISGTAADPPDSLSKISTTKVSQATVRTETKANSELSGGISGIGPSGKKPVAAAVEGGSTVEAVKRSAEDSSTVIGFSVGSQALAASQQPRLAEVPGGAIAASQTAIGAGRERTVKGLANKGPAEDDDVANAASQTASDKDSSTAVPASVLAQSRDLTASAAPVAGTALTAIAEHTTSAPLAAAAVPVHAAGAGAVSGTPAGRAEANLLTAMTAQVSATAQGGDSHRTLVATPTALEVGLQSGTEGWLKIRAETGGQGDVKASLDAVSASGRELLHSQLPALNAFLHSEQMSVTASVAERSTVPDASAAGSAMGSSGFSGASHGALFQQGGDRPASERQMNSPSSETARRSASEALQRYDGQGGISDSIEGLSSRQAGTPGENGRWLNIRV